MPLIQIHWDMAKTTRVGKSLIAVQEELETQEQCLAFL
jgi:hypothetical protein